MLMCCGCCRLDKAGGRAGLDTGAGLSNKLNARQLVKVRGALQVVSPSESFQFAVARNLARRGKGCCFTYFTLVGFNFIVT